MRITQGVHRAVHTRPDALAAVCGERRTTWRQFADRVARLAGGLKGLGVKRGDRVALLMANSDRYMECYVAVPWADAVVVPQNTRWSERELIDAMDDSGARVLILDDAFRDMGGRIAAAMARRPRIIQATDAPAPATARGGLFGRRKAPVDYEALIAASDPAPDAERGGSDIAGIFYTGGTTGRSKGVMLTHDNVMSMSMMMMAEGFFGEKAVYLHAAPMFHLADGTGTFALLLSAGTNVMIPGFDPVTFMKAVERDGVTDVILVPTMIQMLVDHPDIGDYDLSSLKRILFGASPISEAVLERTLTALPHVSLNQLYGMTELSPVATVLHHDNLLGEGQAKGRRRAAGRAAFGVDVAVVDEQGRRLGPGEVGEVIVRSPGVMAGYWKRPEETKKALRDGWMHTGDGGRWDEDGFLYIVDRIKDMIVSGGENVYSAEVENVIAKHPAVAQCAVIGIPSGQWGEQVHAIVHPRPGHELTGEEVAAHCREHLGGYKCPRSVDIRAEPLPLSGAGKILKQVLREPYWREQGRAVS